MWISYDQIIIINTSMLNRELLPCQYSQFFLEPIHQAQKSRSSEDNIVDTPRKAIGYILYLKDLMIFMKDNIAARIDLSNLNNISKLTHDEQIAILNQLHALKPHIEQSALVQVGHPTTLEWIRLTNFYIHELDIFLVQYTQYSLANQNELNDLFRAKRHILNERTFIFLIPLHKLSVLMRSNDPPLRMNQRSFNQFYLMLLLIQ